VWWDDRCLDTEVSSSVPRDIGPFMDREWPTKCVCGYEFTSEDTRMLMVEPIYRADDGREFILREAPVGAMWDAHWYRGTDWKGPDGLSLVVKLPDGAEWCMDAPASGGGRWNRTGEAPKVTVSPSIQTPRWHGWLRDGVLAE
jgi:hypothetical protein